MKLKALFLSTMILSMNLFSLEQQSEKLRILVYNTHGLPEIFISDNPKMRFPVIGKKTQDFSIALLQEDYSHHEELLSGLAKESLAIRGGLGGRLICPFCTVVGQCLAFPQASHHLNKFRFTRIGWVIKPHGLPTLFHAFGEP